MTLLSSREQLDTIRRVLEASVRLPFIRDSIPGSLVELTLAEARSATALNTYDFVDVVCPQEAIGWQVKSTKESTPVTWKRAKIPNATELIRRSFEDPSACQDLGDAVINFCNQHARASLATYELDAIGYARVIVMANGDVRYFEKELITNAHLDIFDPAEFRWEWSVQKKTVKKEQLRALHGHHIPTDEKWWAWHGLGENQLHFGGEKHWWPHGDTSNGFSFVWPSNQDRLSLSALADSLLP